MSLLVETTHRDGGMSLQSETTHRGGGGGGGGRGEGHKKMSISICSEMPSAQQHLEYISFNTVFQSLRFLS